MLLTILTMAVALFLSPTSSLPKRLARGGRQVAICLGVYLFVCQCVGVSVCLCVCLSQM